MPDPNEVLDEPTNICSNCGFDFEGIEVEYCEQGEHCEMCCYCDDLYPEDE